MQNNNIVLVIPFSGEKYGELTQVQLGVGHLAAVLEKEKIEPIILDARAYKLSVSQTTDRILSYNPRVIGISATTSQIMRSFEICRKIKEKSNSTITVIGGSHISALPEETLKECEAIDIGVIGEGEYTFLEIVKSIVNNKELNHVQGLVFRKNGELVMTPPRLLIDDLDSLPFPSRHLFPSQILQSRVSFSKNAPVGNIITSRGCPGKCIFCSNKVFGRKFRERSPENVVTEIEEMVEKYGYKEIHIVDDTFTLNRSRVMKICQLIKEKKINLDFSLPNGVRVDTVDEEILVAMKEAGFYCIYFGVESGDDKVLKMINKNITTEQIYRKIRIAKKMHYFVGIFIMIGLPGSSDESEKKTIEFVKKLDPDFIGFAVTTPYPGSELFARDRERLLKIGWENFRHDFTKKRVLFVPENMNEDKVREWYYLAIKKFYLRPSYWINQLLRHPDWFLRRVFSAGQNALKRLL